jgi:hypothetical protein
VTANVRQSKRNEVNLKPMKRSIVLVIGLGGAVAALAAFGAGFGSGSN